MLGWEPLLDPSPVAAEVHPCPLQADLRRLVPLTKHDDALHMGRYADVSIALGTKHRPNRQLEPVDGGQGIFDPFGDAQNVIRLTKPHAARAEQAQRQLGFVEGPPQRSEEHKSELQSLIRISYAVFCLQKHNETKK